MQIVGCKKLSHRLRFLRRWRKTGGNIFIRQPVMVVGGGAIIERPSQRIEFTPVVKLQPDAYFNNLCWILCSEILGRRNVPRRVVRNEFAAHCTGRQQRTTHHDPNYNT